MFNLTGFQRDLLYTIAGDDSQYGLAIKTKSFGNGGGPVVSQDSKDNGSRVNTATLATPRSF
jgi:hypothetical protein